MIRPLRWQAWLPNGIVSHILCNIPELSPLLRSGWESKVDFIT